MAEQRQPFRFRIPWLPGASAPARTPAEPTQRPVVEPLAAAERVPFQPIARPPFRPAGIAQVSPPPPPPPQKAPSPPRKAPQPPSPPRAAPEFSLPLRPTTQPEEVVQRDAATPSPVPSRPEILPAVMSQSQSPIGASPEGNLKSEAAESVSGSAQPKETPLPSFLKPESSDMKPAKPVASDSLSDPVKAGPPKVLPSTPSETSTFASVDQPPPDLQSRDTLALVSDQQLAADKKPTEPLLVATVPNMAEADPLGPALELKVSSQPSLKNSSTTAVDQPLLGSQPKENSSLQPVVPEVADEKPVKSIDSASVLKSGTSKNQEPAPLVPQVVPPAKPVSSPSRSISPPTGESQGPFHRTFLKLQEDKGVEATDKAESPMEAADSVPSSGKAKEKASTRPVPPLPKKHPKGPLPLASSSNEQKRMKFVPKKNVGMTFKHSNTDHLDSHPRPAEARGTAPLPSPLQKEIRDDMSKFVHSITSGKASMSTIQESVDVITLAGENTGATMHLTLGLEEREEHIHIRRNYRSKPDESIEGTTDVEEEEEWEVDGAEDEESDNNTFLNCNVQGVNNSLVLDSSVSEGSPGVHLEWAPNTEPQTVSRSEAFKNELGITPAENHVYRPTIRRRCLGGLFLDSSDESSNDDKDNPAKPRRHGCRFGYEWKNEEKHVDVE